MLKSLLFSVIIALTFAAKSWAEASNPVVNMQTNLGSITLELFPEQSPETVKNFLSYVDEGFYEGLIFHRTIVGFMIQGGGFNKDLVLKEPKDPVINESQNGLSNKAGTIAMARTRHPHSATSQFFINAVSNRNLDAQGSRFGYTVFGRVTEGMDLVMKISRLPTAPKGMHRDVPVEPIVINKIVRVEPTASASAND
ncbi:peptidylprolyl isomerase [Neptuniibacter sp.]|uniref:peptidylprolyl isomerase n=1 Tax=Neptuniibacter sp. TaxID=1962643 RepID=UPI003B5AA090